jgi:hypothetical protein
MADDDYGYLASLSKHRNRPGDTANLNPAFVHPLANAIRQAQAAGLNVGIESGFREPTQTGSAYDAGGNSSHSYGLAADISGLGGANSPAVQQWQKIAEANGLHNPYGIGDAVEFNHWQLPPQPLEKNPQLLASLQAAKATGNFQNVWSAYNSGGGAQTASAAPAAPSYTFKLPANAPMGMGNNNPLNIKYYKGAEAHYPGLVGPSTNTDQGDPQMKFATPEAGWSAAYSLLNQKYGSGMTTPNQIIAGKGGWTPGNTQAAANVAKSAGIGPNDDIGFSDPAKAQKFMRALVTQEQGGAGSAYPDEMIAAAVGGKAPPGTATASAAPVGTTLTSVGGGDAGKLPGFGTAAASKSFTEGLEKLAPGLTGGAGGQGGQGPQVQPSPIIPPPAARGVSPLLPLAPAMEAQLTGYSPKPYGQTLNSFAAPLQWGSAPPGASPYAPAAGGNPLSVQPPNQQGAGTQMAATSPIGTSLTSLDPQAYQDRLAMLYGTSGGQGYG